MPNRRRACVQQFCSTAALHSILQGPAACPPASKAIRMSVSDLLRCEPHCLPKLKFQQTPDGPRSRHKGAVYRPSRVNRRQVAIRLTAPPEIEPYRLADNIRREPVPFERDRAHAASLLETCSTSPDSTDRGVRPCAAYENSAYIVKIEKIVSG